MKVSSLHNVSVHLRSVAALRRGSLLSSGALGGVSEIRFSAACWGGPSPPCAGVVTKHSPGSALFCPYDNMCVLDKDLKCEGQMDPWPGNTYNFAKLKSQKKYEYFFCDFGSGHPCGIRSLRGYCMALA